jgi:hypothetical protein
MSTERTTPQQAEWYAHAVIGTDDETSEADGYFRGDKPVRSDLGIPQGWRVLEFSARKTGNR